MKCWIRREGHWWQLGCQHCGCIVFEDWSWRWVIRALDDHIWKHRAHG